MNRHKLLQHGIDILYEIAGSILIAIAVCNFALTAKFPMTGFSGIAIILNRFFRVPIGLSTVALNLPVILICYRLIGRSFLLKSFRCMIISSVFIDYIAPLFPVYTGSRLLAALVTGVVGGIGYAVIYTRGSSTGGADFLIMAFIVTKPRKEVCNIIDECSNRGSTIIKSRGGYRLEEKETVMVVSNRKQMYRILQNVTAYDNEAFIILLEAHEIHGKGFPFYSCRITSIFL